MTKSSGRAVTEAESATRQEIDDAFGSLTQGELVKLKKFAAWRVRGLGRADVEHDGEALLHDAVLATLVGCDGRRGRRWNKRVDFVKHLTEVMRSISSHWQEKGKRTPVSGRAVVPNVGGKAVRDSHVSREPSAERKFAAKEAVAEIFELLKEDKEALLVLEALRTGMLRKDIVGVKLGQQQYDTAMKRIRYAVQRKEKGERRETQEP
jgi:hypothetical protein